MKILFQCEQCGADEFTEKNGLRICAYCGTKFVLEKNDAGIVESNPGIAINEDVQRLLDKCRIDPQHAKRYASLALDIDPTNQEALKYL